MSWVLFYTGWSGIAFPRRRHFCRELQGMWKSGRKTLRTERLTRAKALKLECHWSILRVKWQRGIETDEISEVGGELSWGSCLPCFRFGLSLCEWETIGVLSYKWLCLNKKEFWQNLIAYYFICNQTNILVWSDNRFFLSDS